MTIFAGVQLYRSEHEGCPTIDDLIRAKFLDPSKAHTDPWGNPFQIICTPKQLWIQSAGPDEARHTEDDLEFRQPSPNPGTSSSR